MKTPRISMFDEKFKPDYKSLNIEWIQKYFEVERKDLEQLDHPEQCLAEGGQIFFATVDDRALGTCAMYKVAPRRYELAKMGVHPESRGLGLGDLLMNAAEEWARAQDATEILILSNTVLNPAITLYKKHGFKTVRLGPHPDYQRCNIEMIKVLE